MLLAVISDLHGNYKALEAFLERAEALRPDGILCLGDYVTDSPYPQRLLSLLYEMTEKYPCRLVKGNREKYLVDNFHTPFGWRPSSGNGTLWYTARNLAEKDVAFFESLPVTERVTVPGYPALTLCHGTPGELRGNLRAGAKLRDETFASMETPWLLGGHSHHQELEERDGRTYLNPGSLGLSMDGVGGRAQYALLFGEKGAWRAQLCSIPYDVDAFLQDFTSSGLDGYGMILNRGVKKTLVTGVNYFYMTVVEALRISGKNLDEIPEDVWEEAAKRLGV